MRFLVLKRPASTESSALTDYVDTDGSKTWPAPQCTLCWSIIGSLPLLPPIIVELECWGASFGDIVFGSGNELLLNEGLLNSFHASRLNGLIEIAPVDVVHVTVHRKLLGELPRYRCCRISQSRAIIDDAASGLDRQLPWTCPECHSGGVIKSLKRIVLEPNSWSGEDVFYARGLPGTVLVSERFEALFNREQFSNCVLIPTEQFNFDYYPSRE
jgi:hypothetical protein